MVRSSCQEPAELVESACELRDGHANGLTWECRGHANNGDWLVLRSGCRHPSVGFFPNLIQFLMSINIVVALGTFKGLFVLLSHAERVYSHALHFRRTVSFRYTMFVGI